MKTFLSSILIIATSMSAHAQTFYAPMAQQADLTGPVKIVQTRTYSGIGDSPDSIISVEKEEFDKQGNLVQSRKLSLDGELLSEVRNFFDGDGHWVGVQQQAQETGPEKLQVLLDPETSTIEKLSDKGGRIVTTYNDAGFEGESIHYNAEGNVEQKIQTIRNAENQETEQLFTAADGGSLKKISIQWTPESHRKSVTSESSDGVTTTTDYEYKTFDEHGNWTERLETQVSKLPFGTERNEKLQIREITYHNADEESE